MKKISLLFAAFMLMGFVTDDSHLSKKQVQEFPGNVTVKLKAYEAIYVIGSHGDEIRPSEAGRIVRTKIKFINKGSQDLVINVNNIKLVCVDEELDSHGIYKFDMLGTRLTGNYTVKAGGKVTMIVDYMVRYDILPVSIKLDKLGEMKFQNPGL